MYKLHLSSRDARPGDERGTWGANVKFFLREAL